MNPNPRIHLTDETLMLFRDPEVQYSALNAIWERNYAACPKWSKQYDVRGEVHEEHEHWTDEG
jgi:hypothetical protein